MAQGMNVKSGKRLPAKLVDYLAETNPTQRFAVVPKGSEVQDGYHEMTVKELAQAVNYISWWIENTIGKSTGPETISYMGSNDIRYFIFVLACNKTRYWPFLPSTRNSEEANEHLFKATKCNKFVHSPEMVRKVQDFKKFQPGLEVFEMPSLWTMLASESPLYPYDEVFEQVEDAIALIIHSSGTTGLPKPVYLTNGYMGCLDRLATMPVPEGRRHAIWWDWPSRNTVLSVTPLFHMMGYFALTVSLFHGVPSVLVPDKPLTPNLIIDAIMAANPSGAVIPPSLLEELSHSKRGLEAVSSLDSLFFGGAALSPEIGGRLSKLTNLKNIIGTSECGLLPTVAPRGRDDWIYHEWVPGSGIEMQPVGGNLFELVITRDSNRDWQGIFHTFPDLQEYRTKDVYTRSATNPNGWVYYGRIDDIVVLSNGEKFNPVTMEKVIESHPLVTGAVVAGQGRFQSALLIEPNWNEWKGEEQSEHTLIDKIWPVVERANAGAVAHSRIAKSKIGISSRDKPFKRTAKGSIQRRHVYREYEKELEAIYAREDEDVGIELPEKLDLPAIRGYIHQVFSSLFTDAEIGEGDDFYAAGFDSLQSVQFSRILRQAFSARFPDGSCEAITAQQIYSHPTIDSLSIFVNGLVNGGTNGKHDDSEARRHMLDDLVRKYAEGLPVQKQDINVEDGRQMHSIILTGSTGSLGNYVLDALLDDPFTAKVYCLNRSADGNLRQTVSFQEKGLQWDDSRRGKVEFLQASFGEEKFGLEDAKYNEMLKTVDTVIHNAWKVDFNQSVSSFEDVHIRGVRRFIDFCLQSTHHAHLHFVSSVATIGAWTPKHGPAVTEEAVQDPDVTIPQGYGESKHVGERLCLTASSQSGVPTTILRVGQVAGPTKTTGEWNRHEWLPTIIATSKTTGRIPNSLGTGPVNWIPVDTLATIITELVQTRRRTQDQTRCAAFNLVNPSITSWTSLIPTIQKHYAVQPVELKDWVDDLEQIQNPTQVDLAEKPALKLLGFYRGLTHESGALSYPMELTKTKEASETIRTRCPPVDGPMMENWLRQWAF